MCLIEYDVKSILEFSPLYVVNTNWDVKTNPDEHDLKISTGVLPRVPFKNPLKI